MELIDLESVQSIDVLSGVFVVTSPDGLLMEAWQRPNVHFDFGHVISLFGEVLRPTAEIAQHLGAEAPSSLMMECDAGIIIARSLSSNFFCVFLFSPHTPLGLLRIYTDQICQAMGNELPSFPDEDLPSLGLSTLSPALTRPSPTPSSHSATSQAPSHITRAQRLVQLFLSSVPEHSHDDQHTALMQLAMATNLTVHDLQACEHLEPSTIPRIESAVRSLLGLDQLSV